MPSVQYANLPPVVQQQLTELQWALFTPSARRSLLRRLTQLQFENGELDDGSGATPPWAVELIAQYVAKQCSEAGSAMQEDPQRASKEREGIVALPDHLKPSEVVVAGDCVASELGVVRKQRPSKPLLEAKKTISEGL